MDFYFSLTYNHNFNPRTPRGVRPGCLADGAHDSKFQSTHPARGATIAARNFANAIMISIHAPREGCDPFMLSGYTEEDYGFQSTHPARGATGYGNVLSVSRSGFQSTHPARGATALSAAVLLHPLISIHAPREGCDRRPLTPYLGL